MNLGQGVLCCSHFASTEEMPVKFRLTKPPILPFNATTNGCHMMLDATAPSPGTRVQVKTEPRGLKALEIAQFQGRPQRRATARGRPA